MKAKGRAREARGRGPWGDPPPRRSPAPRYLPPEKRTSSPWWMARLGPSSIFLRLPSDIITAISMMTSWAGRRRKEGGRAERGL